MKTVCFQSPETTGQFSRLAQAGKSLTDMEMASMFVNLRTQNYGIDTDVMLGIRCIYSTAIPPISEVPSG